MAEGRFREDLLSRLGNCWIHLPPLRERPQEILPLLTYYLGRITAERGLRPIHLSPELTQTMVAAPWIYNIRSLVSECDSLVTADPSDRVLRIEHLSDRFWVEVRRALACLTSKEGRLRMALGVTGGRRMLAAQLLEVSERTVYRALAGGMPEAPRRGRRGVSADHEMRRDGTK